jgi:transglutaminase-like putative cysteine protease/sugar lactone lactonase YvrE
MPFVMALLLLFLPTGGLRAVPGARLRELPAPSPCPTGLVWHGGKLWLADHKTDALMELDPTSGKVTRSLRSPGRRPMGLASGRGLLWNADAASGWIYGLDPATGHTKASFESPRPYPIALAWSGKALWLYTRGAKNIHLIDAEDGTTMRSTPVPGTSVDGLAFDGRYLWIVDRISDRVYVQDPGRDEVIFSFATPGPHPTGIAFDGRSIWIVDYQQRRIAKLVHDDGQVVARTSRHLLDVEHTFELHNHGPDRLERADLFLALPARHPTFELVGPLELLAPGSKTVTDQWGQRAAHYVFDRVASGATLKVGWRARARLFEVSAFPYPHKVGPLGQLPAEARRYLADADKYDLRHPAIQKAVREAVGGEKNPYWAARRIYRYIHKRMVYKLSGGWNAAPRVLARGSGSCSEYSFVFIAMCRAAGIPARYVGAVVLRKDLASWDDVYHRWVELYLPGLGWLPVDPSRGDKPTEAERGDAFGNLTADFLVTTQGGGGSSALRWTYNHDARWSCQGRCLVRDESIAEWSPVKTQASPARGVAGGAPAP